MSNEKVWFVTGASELFGLELTKCLLENGFCVAATSLYKGILEKEVTRYTQKFLPLTADPSDEASIGAAIRQTIVRFGRIDTVVNNAGHIPFRAMDELSETELHSIFEESVFGSYHVLQQVIPYLTEEHSLHIFNFNSPAVRAAVSNSTLFAATKLAVESLSDALLEDTGHTDIRQTTITVPPSGTYTENHPVAISGSLYVTESQNHSKSGFPDQENPGISNQMNAEILNLMNPGSMSDSQQDEEEDLARVVAAVMRLAREKSIKHSTFSY
jgi:NADP-dependent 3-hydroxy acid dehydrogenase YdfG